MKNTISIVLIIMLSCSDGKSQDIFIARNGDGIYKLLTNDNLEWLVNLEVSVNDITISPSNKLYGMTSLEGIIEIDWQTGEYETISSDLYLSSNSLVCASENELFYISSTSLYKYDIPQDSSIFIAELGYSTPGDICILGRNIIFPTLYDIKAYNLDRQSLSTVYCFPELQVYWGISTMYSDCDSSTILLSNTSTANNPDFLKIDLISGNSTPIEGYPISNAQIWGMATSKEFEGMECESWISTDTDCEDIISNSTNDQADNALSVFPNPVDQILRLDGCNNLSTVAIYDNKGMILTNIPNARNEIDMSQFVNGIYFVKIVCGANNSLHKIIKH